MRRTILIYGLAMAALLGILKYIEYQFFVRDIPLEFYIGLVAVIFTALGVWAGLRLTRPKVGLGEGAETLRRFPPDSLPVHGRDIDLGDVLASALADVSDSEADPDGPPAGPSG